MVPNRATHHICFKLATLLSLLNLQSKDQSPPSEMFSMEIFEILQNSYSIEQFQTVTSQVQLSASSTSSIIFSSFISFRRLISLSITNGNTKESLVFCFQGYRKRKLPKMAHNWSVSLKENNFTLSPTTFVILNETQNGILSLERLQVCRM